MDMEQETAHYCRQSIVLTNGQGIPNHVDMPSEQYDGIAHMIYLPDVYMFCKWFVSALHDSLCNEVLKKGYNTKFSTIDQLYETACMIEEASHYNHGM